MRSIKLDFTCKLDECMYKIPVCIEQHPLKEGGVGWVCEQLIVRGKQ